MKTFIYKDSTNENVLIFIYANSEGEAFETLKKTVLNEHRFSLK